jgi:hypothetical protein
MVDIGTYRVGECNNAVHVVFANSGVPDQEHCEPSTVCGYPRVPCALRVAMNLVCGLVHQRVELGEQRYQTRTARRQTSGERTSAGSEILILQSHPSGMRMDSEGVIHDPRGRHLPSSSGDLLRSPGWSFKFSLISWIVPETGAYCVPILVVTRRKFDQEKRRGQVKGLGTQRYRRPP